MASPRAKLSEALVSGASAAAEARWSARRQWADRNVGHAGAGKADAGGYPTLVDQHATRRIGGLNACTLPVLAAAAEWIVLAAATGAAGWLYHEIVFGQLPAAALYVVATLVLVSGYVGACGFGRDYSIKRLHDAKEQIHSVLLRWNVAYSLLVFAMFMTRATDFYSRGSIIVQYAVGLTLAIVVRAVMARLVTRGLLGGRLSGKTVIVVGDATMVDETVRRLRSDCRGASVVGTVRLDPSPAAALAGSDAVDGARNGEAMRGALHEIGRLSRHVPPDDIVICLPWSDGERIRVLVDELGKIPAALHLAPNQTSQWLQNPTPAHVGSMPTIQLSGAPLTLRDRVLKRMFDIAVASVLIVVAIPFVALIALAIKLESPGPVLFRQRRNGFNHREFRVLKLRTMTTMDDGSVIRQATRGDRRVTRVGRLLRSTNLDELPQLFNVLAGDMSVVGPRPHAVAHNCEYEERIRLYARRHNVKPGITGWAQVNGCRGATESIEEMRQRVEHDLFYIDHWSLLFDIKILIMTLFSQRSYRNAY